RRAGSTSTARCSSPATARPAWPSRAAASSRPRLPCGADSRQQESHRRCRCKKAASNLPRTEADLSIIAKDRHSMSEYKSLESRLAAKDVVILDGAVGTQLQKMGVPMSNLAWAATALQTHPSTVRFMHESYIRAGVDIITVNTYSAARHNLVPLGLGDLTRELNLRAVALAQEARDRCAKERPVYIAGSVSNYG